MIEPLKPAELDRLLTVFEKAGIEHALTEQRPVVKEITPCLSREDAVALDAWRRVRTANMGAPPPISQLAEHLGWTKQATADVIFRLIKKGYLRPQKKSGGNTFSDLVETIEAIAFPKLAALVAFTYRVARDPDAPAVHRHAAMDALRPLLRHIEGETYDVQLRAERDELPIKPVY